MKFRAILRLAVVLSWSVMTGGCAGLFKEPSPAKAIFLIDPGRPGASHAQGAVEPVSLGRVDAVLKVRQLRVVAPFDGSAFIYKVGPNQYVSDYYSAFLMSTDTMLSVDVRQWLDRSGLFAHVVDGASSVRTYYNLEGSVSAFYADFTDSRAPRATVQAQFILLSEEHVGLQILFEKSYVISAPITSHGPAGIVDGWNHACRTLFDELTADLGQVLPVDVRSRRPSTGSS